MATVSAELPNKVVIALGEEHSAKDAVARANELLPLLMGLLALDNLIDKEIKTLPADTQKAIIAVASTGYLLLEEAQRRFDEASMIARGEISASDVGFPEFDCAVGDELE